MLNNNISNNQISIAVADDSLIFRYTISLFLEKDSRFRLVGLYENGMEMISGIKGMTTVPNIYLIDILMPVCDGIETVRLLKQNYDELLIFGYSSTDDRALVDRMYQLGVKEVFRKGEQSFVKVLDQIWETYSSLFK